MLRGPGWTDTGVPDVEVAGGPVAAAFGLAGVLAGVAARLLLGRLRRGAAVPAGSCEVLLAGLWASAGLGWALGLVPGRLLPLLLGLGWLGVAAGSVDVLHRRLPDALTVPAIPAGLVLLAPVGPVAVGRGVAGAAVALSLYGVLHLLSPTSLGAGDVKLAGSLGAALTGLSWSATLLAAVLAGLVTVGLALLTRQPVVPHGPGMLAAAWVVAVGQAVVGAPLGATGGG
jgi:leader peptidase (prepilin peptidase) / N-methyltransferase